MTLAVRILGRFDRLPSVSTGVPVTIYQGQLDLICCTLGVETWLQRLKWPGLAAFNAAPHEPFYAHHHEDSTAGFMRRHENLAMYYVMSAGANLCPCLHCDLGPTCVRPRTSVMQGATL